MFRAIAIVSVCLAGLGLGSVARAEKHGSCEGCGHSCGLTPFCKLICEPKTVTKVVYDCETEPFCLPGPSRKCGCKWIPTCGCVRERSKLVKHEVKKEVPAYKCVVQYRCARCCQAGAQENEATLAQMEGAGETAPQAISQLRETADMVIIEDTVAPAEGVIAQPQAIRPTDAAGIAAEDSADASNEVAPVTHLEDFVDEDIAADRPVTSKPAKPRYLMDLFRR